MSAQVIPLQPKPYAGFCLIDGCGRDTTGEHLVLVTGYDIDNTQQTIELELCRAHGLAFELVREVNN